MFVMIGGTKPDLIIHGVMNSANPYPQTFLLTVMATISEPATGLYESTAYVVTMAGIADT